MYYCIHSISLVCKLKGFVPHVKGKKDSNTRVTSLSNQPEACWSLAATSTSTKVLTQLVNAAVAKAHEQSVANLGRLAWSVVELGDVALARRALYRVLEEMEGRIMQPVQPVQVLDISQVVWAMARLRVHSDAAATLKKAAIKELHACDSRHLSNLAWSFAKLSKLDGPFMKHLAAHAAEIVNTFGPQELSNTLWALAAATQPAHPDEDVVYQHVDLLFAAAGGLPRSFSGQQLANVLWAAARLGSGGEASLRSPRRRDCSVFVALANVAAQRTMELAPQQLAAIVWACAAAGGASLHSKRSGGHRDPELLSALEHAIASRITAAWQLSLKCAVMLVGAHKLWPAFFQEMTPRALANILWGFATLIYLPESQHPRTQICAAAASCSAQMSIQEFAITAWSMGTLRTSTHLETLAGKADHLQRSAVATNEVGNLVWGLSYARLSPSSVPTRLHEMIGDAIEGLAYERRSGPPDLRGLAMLARGLMQLNLHASFCHLLDHTLIAVPELTAAAWLSTASFVLTDTPAGFHGCNVSV